MNLYTWMNRRHHDKFIAKAEKALDDIRSGNQVTYSWDEWIANREARHAAWEARPWWVKKTVMVRVSLFGVDGWVSVKLHPRTIVNRVVWHHQRATRGWCDSDCWSTDRYITRVLAGMLTHLAARNETCPECSPWETPEKWTAHLHDLSTRLQAWSVDETQENVEITKAALREFTENLGVYWD